MDATRQPLMISCISLLSKFEKNVVESNEKALESYRSSTMTLFGHALSCFFEFCWTGSVAINGKFVRNYSGFRDEMRTFVSTACELASGKKALSLQTHIADVLDGETGGLSVGHVKDESDEARAITRIKMAIPQAMQTGMDTFVREVLVLPLEFHAQFTQAPGVSKIRGRSKFEY